MSNEDMKYLIKGDSVDKNFTSKKLFTVIINTRVLAKKYQMTIISSSFSNSVFQVPRKECVDKN